MNAQKSNLEIYLGEDQHLVFETDDTKAHTGFYSGVIGSGSSTDVESTTSRQVGEVTTIDETKEEEKSSESIVSKGEQANESVDKPNSDGPSPEVIQRIVEDV